MTHSILSKFLIAGIGAVLLSATVVGCASAATKSGKIRSLQRSDYISQEDIKKAPGGYRLYVNGIGDVLVKELRAPKGSGKKCLVEKRSLRELVRVALRDTKGQTWLKMQLIPLDPSLGLGSSVCFGLGKGCYILVGKS